jgi:paraquat-inducible protein B
MADENASSSKPDIARPIVSQPRSFRFSWVWLVPLVALVIGLSLVVRTWINTGPTITISFQSAEGLEVGQTKIRYKDVVVGAVTDIRVASDRSHVLVDAQLDPHASDYITREGARFWVVKPRVGIGGISGLGTLLSGAYISVDINSAEQKKAGNAAVYRFTGLEKPPAVTNDRSGTRFVLHAAELSSIEIGSPVYFRQLPVGRVIDYELSEDGHNVNIQIFIDAPYNRFVTTDSRFWNASGVNINLGASGIEVNTGSLAAVISGGIAFANADPSNETPAPAQTVFDLHESQKQALADPDGTPFRLDLVFHQSVRGLKVGAPVEFRGMELGKVYDIDLEFDSKARQFYILVKTHIYPRRFGVAYEKIRALDKDNRYPGGELLAPMVKHGLRAQLQPANILTGQQYVAVDFFRDADPVEFDPHAQPLVLPTIAGNFDRLQQQISTIVSKLEAVPFDGIGKDLRSSLQSLDKTLREFNTKVAPQAAGALKAAQSSLEKVDQLLSADSPLNSNLERTMRELTGAARSLRNLGDYLQTHPRALISGRAPDQLPE